MGVRDGEKKNGGGICKSIKGKGHLILFFFEVVLSELLIFSGSAAHLRSLTFHKILWSRVSNQQASRLFSL